LKPETRLLIVACTENNLCLAVITRGFGLDGIVAGSDCDEMCLNLRRGGFLGELKYCLGPCCCGLSQPPINRRIAIIAKAWIRFLEDVINQYIQLEESGTCCFSLSRSQSATRCRK
jgi:hypothetical protein